MRHFLHQALGLAFVAAAVLTGLPAARADVTMPGVFGDAMVIQQGMEAPVWGKADPGEAVTVSFAGHERKAVADKQGRWMVRLPVLQATPGQVGQAMTVQGNNRLTFNDVLIGEVWLCSGQSNMQWRMSQIGVRKEYFDAADLPQVRMLTVIATQPGESPATDHGGQWHVCTPETLRQFSAVAFYFGRELHDRLGVPIGLINSSVGGTVAEAWTSHEALHANLPEFDEAYAKFVQPGDELARQKALYAEAVKAYQEAVEKLKALEADELAAQTIAGEVYDDTGWKTMAIPGYWEGRGLRTLDGAVWFRKTIVVPPAWQGKELVLHLGPIHEADITWFNGQEVGRSGNLGKRDVARQNTPRDYRVPGELVKAGTNVIAIRVMDMSRQGGLWGSPAQKMNVVLADESDKTPIPLAGEWRYFVEMALPNRPVNPARPNRPAVLFNSRIHPLIPYAIRGATWYQGEANVSRAAQYRKLLPTLIADWRSRWGQGDFPFLIVQLAGYGREHPGEFDTPWANLREAQAFTARTVPNTGLAVAIDIGDPGNIHPTNKQDVGRRLALIALAKAYGKEEVIYSGPQYKRMLIEGSEARIIFNHIDDGLRIKGDKLEGFVIVGEDGQFHPADARIEKGDVIVRSDKVAKPVAVRYAWGNTPRATLCNGAGLPAVPFATDKWSNEP